MCVHLSVSISRALCGHRGGCLSGFWRLRQPGSDARAAIATMMTGQAWRMLPI
jgi:hypothetical protein